MQRSPCSRFPPRSPQMHGGPQAIPIIRYSSTSGPIISRADCVHIQTSQNAIIQISSTRKRLSVRRFDCAVGLVRATRDDRGQRSWRCTLRLGECLNPRCLWLHLRHILLFLTWSITTTLGHSSLDKDAPAPRAVQAVGPSSRRQFSADCTINRNT